MKRIATGFLQVQALTCNHERGIEDVFIRIYRYACEQLVYEDFFISDSWGNTISIPLLTPCVKASFTTSSDQPYACYHVDVRKKGWQTLHIKDVQIFAQVRTTLQVEMSPILDSNPMEQTYSITPHHLLSPKERFSLSPLKLSKGVKSDMLREVIIPTSITVHLGRPDRNAENITVPFLYYLKNVASSEIYPTWPNEALKANIWAQISLVLNRIYTEWYPSQGYNFDITNSTAFDQAFVRNRNIYDNIAAIVDEVFNEYIQKRNFSEPFYAEYCDGKIAQCPGMKQWGTLDLANRGFDAFAILRYYYGDQIRIVSSDNIQAIQASYPGVPLRLGDSGEVVAQLQAQLNAIAINYPNIKPIFPVNGIFNISTEDAVRVFQRQFRLSVDGIVGKATYYRISYVYAAVRKLAELGSIGDLTTLYSGIWQGRVLKEGDRSTETQLMQYYLASISLFYPEIPVVSIDGRFATGTLNAVLAFQRRFGLTVDGLVGQTTWDRIYIVYTSIEEQIPNQITLLPYPGIPLQLGSVGDSVLALQNALIKIQELYNLPFLQADGVFGNQTRNAVLALQSALGQQVDGIVGPLTWNAIFANAANQEDAFASDVVKKLQTQLQMVSQYYPTVPVIQTSEVFDKETSNALKALQNLLGLEASGDIDEETQKALNALYMELNSK